MHSSRSSQLVDHRGRPIHLDDLQTERSGPSITGVRDVWSSHASGNLTPQRLGSILREAEVPGDGSAERYVELAERMEERDLHYLGVLETRKRQVAQIGVAVEPASDHVNDVRDADLVREFFSREEIEDELFDLLDSIAKGYSVTEIIWDMSERQWMPERLEWRLPQWFEFDRDTGSVLTRRDDNGGYVELEAWKHVTHITKAKSGLAIRGGIARCAAWAWMFKSYTMKDWMRFAEGYGHPLRLGKYGRGADVGDKEILYRAVANIASDAAAIVPQDMDIEFVADNNASGRSEIYRDLINYIDSRISIAVLGQTLTTADGDSGSYALGHVHNLVRADIERADARQLAATLRRDLAIPMVALNHGRRDRWPRIIIERKKSEDILRLSDTLEKLVPLGLRVRAEEVRARIGLQKPEPGDEVLAPSVPEMARGEGGARIAMAENDPNLSATALEQVLDAIDADEWQQLAAPLIEPILIRAAADPEGLLEDIAGLYPELNTDSLAEQLTQLLFVADVWGRLQSPADA